MSDSETVRVVEWKPLVLVSPEISGRGVNEIVSTVRSTYETKGNEDAFITVREDGTGGYEIGTQVYVESVAVPDQTLERALEEFVGAIKEALGPNIEVEVLDPRGFYGGQS